ncbi:MAG: 50S ribosomal protein L5 [Thaumarchaeota archaeon]|nr:50S ribosomal protein L5 [Nitrososphaerota archaeon]MDE1866478.1 50S ribosomal protein L5 [Nitrososphaerota archaeon]
MSQKMESIMKKITVAKVVLNMGVGKSGDPIEKAKRALEQISGQKPNPRAAKATQRDWGVHKGEPIGVAVTIRKKPALELIKRLISAKGSQLKGSSFDEFGNVSFGIREHIDIPGVKYDPDVGIVGLNITISLTRPGFGIRFRSKHKASIGNTHRITAQDAKDFLAREFGVQVV